MVIPGLLLISVRRYDCRNEKRLNAVATPKTQGQGGVHTFRMRTVSEEVENRVKELFNGPMSMRFVTVFC